jgi:hypothetical protein
MHFDNNGGNDNTKHTMEFYYPLLRKRSKTELKNQARHEKILRIGRDTAILHSILLQFASMKQYNIGNLSQKLFDFLSMVPESISIVQS